MPTYRIFCEELDDYIIVESEFLPLTCGPSGESIVNQKLTTIVRGTNAENTDTLVVQELLDKTLTNPSNNITANSLRLIGGGSINVTAAPPVAGQVLTAISATEAFWTTSTGTAQYFDGYDSAGGTDISAGFTDVPLGTERKKTFDFTHTAGSAEVTMTTTATYSIFYSCSTLITVGTVRSESEARLMINTGAGFVLVPGSVGTMYNRIDVQGTTSCSRTVILDITAGDIIKLQASRISSISTIVTAAGASSLVILRNEGTGDTGPQGPPGIGFGDADDLNTTGFEVNVSLADPPTTGQFLRATSETTSEWQGITSESQIIYVGKHGLDTNDGLTIDRAKLTFTGAITAATALTPTATNIIGIVCKDAGIYVEAIIMISFTYIMAPLAKIEGTISLTSDTALTAHTVENDTTFGGNSVFKLGSSGDAWVNLKRLECIGFCNGVVNLGTDSIIYFNCDEVLVTIGVAIFDVPTLTGRTIFNVGDITISGFGGRGLQLSFFIFGLNTTVGRVGRIMEIGAGVGTGITGGFGTLNIIVNKIDCTTAYIITGTASMNMIANEIIGTRTVTTTGFVNVVINKLGTGGTEIGSLDDLRVKYVEGGLIKSQITATSLADADTVATIAQVLTRIIRMTPTAARTITLPTPAALVAGVNNAAAGDSFNFSVINEAAGFTVDVDPDTGTTIGNATVAVSSTGLFRVRITVITGGSEAYELYRIR